MHIDFLTGVCDQNQLKVFSDVLLENVSGMDECLPNEKEDHNGSRD